MFAKGRNHLEAEIDFMYDAYKGLIERVKTVYAKDLEDIRKSIESISSDASLDDEEKDTCISSLLEWEAEIQDKENHSRIALFASVFSFWEQSLLRFCIFYKKKILKKNGEENPTPKIKDYLKALLGGTNTPQISPMLTSQLDELRNYFIHGTLTEKRKQVLDNLFESGGINLVKCEGKYYFSSYDGLLKVLDIIKDALSKI